MRGEFVAVWPETWRGIWEPLSLEPLSDGERSVPTDIFCELFRELSRALREPEREDAVRLIVNDAVLLREAFESAALHASPNSERGAVEASFDSSGATDHELEAERRTAVESALRNLVGGSGPARLADALAALAADPQKRAEARERALDRIINDPVRSRSALQDVAGKDIAGERALMVFLEAAHDIAQEFGGDELSNRYFNLLVGFIDKFSLRYDLRRPCILCPTLPGMFASLIRDLRSTTSQDPHLDALMKDFEDVVRDLKQDCSDGRIKTCIQKQVNLLEAIGRAYPGVTGTTLGSICEQVGTWPHEKLKSAMKDLYGFASDYPGIRHAGTPANALRAVDMRDMVALSIMLAGFTPYLSNVLDLDIVYRGA